MNLKHKAVGFTLVAHHFLSITYLPRPSSRRMVSAQQEAHPSAIKVSALIFPNRSRILVMESSVLSCADSTPLDCLWVGCWNVWKRVAMLFVLSSRKAVCYLSVCKITEDFGLLSKDSTPLHSVHMQWQPMKGNWGKIWCLLIFLTLLQLSSMQENTTLRQNMLSPIERLLDGGRHLY